MSEVRTRIAPSPTGYMHLGTARTALYNWLFARKHGGRFILRVEDTDRERSTEEAVEVIIEGLRWLGLDWDEGPVFQSAREEAHRAAAEKLLARGLARRDDMGSPEKGEAIVFDVPRRDVGYRDLVKGDIVKKADDLEPHIVLVRGNGVSTYNFACVVDDAEMGITHVIRGDDHVANTWKQALIYEALDLKPPEFAHLPMIHNSEGRKLSKRDGAVAVTDYRELGYLPDAMVNYLALLGWSPGDDSEIMSREEIADRFSLDRVRSSPSQFDFKKCEWMNGQYIERTPVDKLAHELRPYVNSAGLSATRMGEEWFLKLVEIMRPRIRKLRDFPEQTGYFFSHSVEIDPKAMAKVLAKEGAREVLIAARETLAKAEPFSAEAIECDLAALAERLDLNMGKVAQPVRVAVTGGTASPPIGETCDLIGRQRCLARIDAALRHLAEDK